MSGTGLPRERLVASPGSKRPAVAMRSLRIGWNPRTLPSICLTATLRESDTAWRAEHEASRYYPAQHHYRTGEVV